MCLKGIINVGRGDLLPLRFLRIPNLFHRRMNTCKQNRTTGQSLPRESITLLTTVLKSFSTSIVIPESSAFTHRDSLSSEEWRKSPFWVLYFTLVMVFSRRECLLECINRFSWMLVLFHFWLKTIGCSYCVKMHRRAHTLWFTGFLCLHLNI